MSWQEDLVGKFCWNPILGFAGVVQRAYGANEYLGAGNVPVPSPVLEFEDGSSAVASDDRQANFQPMSRNAAMLAELSAKVIADGASLLAQHAHAYGLDMKLSALVISTALARQARVLKVIADRKEEPKHEPAPAV